MSIIKDSVSETCLFLIGLLIGIVLDFNILYTYKYIDNKFTSTTNIIIIGLLQLMLNAMIIQYINKYLNVNSSFLVMGLLSPQTFIVKKLYK